MPESLTADQLRKALAIIETHGVLGSQPADSPARVTHAAARLALAVLEQTRAKGMFCSTHWAPLMEPERCTAYESRPAVCVGFQAILVEWAKEEA